MAGLTDICDVTYPVKVGKVTLQVRGLTSEEIFRLAVRFPAVLTLLQGGTASLSEKIEGKTLLAELPDAVWAAMAICTGDPSEAAEAKARSLALSIQISILHKLLKATLQEGIGPFVEMIDEITSMMIVAKKETTETSTSESDGPSPVALTVDLPPLKRPRLRRVG